ncbi:MAG: hypothetical protein GY862_34010 [Gammaproteobacteria bacterium]|nr:hypothetical protein [Gammaproteobacteria bacterium]
MYVSSKQKFLQVFAKAACLPYAFPRKSAGTEKKCARQEGYFHAALLLFILLMSVTSPLVAAGTWIDANNMNSAREHHTSILLHNGKLLAAGGNDGEKPLSSAELYDPATGEWIFTGDLNQARENHSASMLRTGKVLITGGFDDTDYLSSMELYDPVTETWNIAKGSLNTARAGHTVTVLLDGSVLAAGGTDDSGSLAGAELYDPGAGDWTPVISQMNTARTRHTATLLADGSVLASGGYDGVNQLDDSELYDPESNTWRSVKKMSTARENHTAILLRNGKVLVAGGGYGDDNYLSSAELYDPDTDTWNNTTGNLRYAREKHTASLLPDGKVLAAGGYNGANQLSKAELYDPETDSWSVVDSLSSAHANHTATLLANGEVLAAGGRNGENAVAGAKRYVLTMGTWSQTDSQMNNTARTNYSAVMLANGKILVAGGSENQILFSSAELYDPIADVWTSVKSMNSVREWHTATLLPDGKVLIAGGLNAKAQYINAELYDPDTDTWTSGGDYAAGIFHSVTLLANGKVLTAGGIGNKFDSMLYDPVTNTWIRTGNMKTKRKYHTATLLSNGKVLAAGGRSDNNDILASAELYDPTTGVWTDIDTGRMQDPRGYHTASTLLPNGKVLAAGVVTSSGPNAELYDPVAGAWSTAGNLSDAGKAREGSILLPNGKVLLSAGEWPSLYDPAANAWSTVESSITPCCHSIPMFLLANGKVLKVSSSDRSSLYTPGLDFEDSWQPLLNSATPALLPGAALHLGGSGFLGASEASGGSANSSGGNYPLVQLRHIDSGYTRWLSPDPAAPFSDTSFTSLPITDFPMGHALVTLHRNGIAGKPIFIKVISNTAPTLDNSIVMQLTGMEEDPAENFGDSVADILATGAGGMPVSDADPGALPGIAIISADSDNGNWEYSLDGGTDWNVFIPSENTARLLRAATSTRLRFVPNANFHTAFLPQPSIGFRAWDRSGGNNGGTGNAGNNGGGAPFSTAAGRAVIRAVAPAADNPAVTNAAANFKQQNPYGLVISRNPADGKEASHLQITGISNGDLFQNNGVTPIQEGDFITVPQGNAGLKFTPTALADGAFNVQASLSADDSGLGGDPVTAEISVNTPPVLQPITDKSVQLHQLLKFTAEVAANQENNRIEFGLLDAPPGADIDTSTGEFRWQPTSLGEFNITVQAVETDGSPGDLAGSEDFTVAVEIELHPPVISPAAANENSQTGSGLVISRNIKDGPEVSHFKISEISDGTLFHNDGITPINEGSFITFAQGNAGLRFTPDSTATGSFKVQSFTANDDSGLGSTPTKTEISVNTAPVFMPVEDKAVARHELLNFIPKIVVNVEEKNQFVFTLAGAPAGASINPDSGEFNWRPAADSGTFNITLVVSETNGKPANLGSSETFQVQVDEIPALDPVGDKNVITGTPLRFTARATHPQKRDLRFSLVEAPAEANIDPASGDFEWIPDQAGIFFLTVKVTEPISDLSMEEKIQVEVYPARTRLSLTLDKPVIFQNGALEVKGKLEHSSRSAESLNRLDILLSITDPDANPVLLDTQTHNEQGEYVFTGLPDFDQEGTYVFQAEFAGTSDLNAAASLPPQYLQVRALAGYALMIQGRIADDPQGEKAHNKSLNRVYRKLKARQFVDEAEKNNIVYLNYDPEQAGAADVQVDGVPSAENIENAFGELQTRMNADPGPLYIVMLDHGGADGRFFIENGNGETLAPADLAAWLDALEAGLTPNALLYPRIVIVGACYSGGMIPVLSKPGRVIVTSTAAAEESYKGPKEPDKLRSGEFFMEALFHLLGQGKSLKHSFQIAAESTETLTRIDGSADFDPYFQDRAAQHPLLEDDGDGKGTNVLSSGWGDGVKAEEIYLGIGPRIDPYRADGPAEILAVTPALFLEAGEESAAGLTARVNNPDRVEDKSVIVDIRAPSMTLEQYGTEQTGQLEINGMTRVLLGFDVENRFGGSYADFSEAGKYEVFYFVTDKPTGNISALKRSVVYKNKAGNHAPDSFALLSPENDERTATTLIFDWERTYDVDGDALTYTFLVSTDPDFRKISFRQEDLTASMTYIDKSMPVSDGLDEATLGLRDGTRYFWKVMAVDEFGALNIDAEVFSFVTDDTNVPSGNIVSGSYFSDMTEEDLSGPQIETFLEADIPVFHDNQGGYGQYFASVPADMTEFTLNMSGHESQTVGLDPAYGTNTAVTQMDPYGDQPDGTPGSLQFSVNEERVNEDQGTVNLLVHRVNGADGEISIQYDTLDDSATKNHDFRLNPGVLTWADQDDLSKPLSIEIIEDALSEDDEIFTVLLYNPGGGAVLNEPGEIRVIIEDKSWSMCTLQFSQPVYRVKENAEAVTVTVTREGGCAGEMSVHYETEEGTAEAGVDFSLVEDTFTWADGETGAKTFTVPVFFDIMPEDDETVKLILSLPDDVQGASLGELHEAWLFIEDTPCTLQFSQPVYSVKENAEAITVTVTREGGCTGEISVYYATEGKTAEADVDFGSVDGVLAWTDGETGAKIFTVPVLPDTENEGSETVNLVLSDDAQGTFSEALLYIVDAYPSLGDGMAVDGNGKNIATDARFAGGTVLEGRDYQVDAVTQASESWPVLITVEITADSGHVGLPADILVVAGLSSLALPEAEEFFVLADEIYPLDLNDLKLDSIKPVLPGVILAEKQTIDIFSGTLGAVPFRVRLYFAYRLEDGALVFNGEQVINLVAY